jgi:integrase
LEAFLLRSSERVSNSTSGAGRFGRDDSVRPAKLTGCYKQAAAKAGFPKMRLHDLRHTVVTYLIESGLSPKTVQEFVGHMDARFTLKQYAHIANESKRKSSQIISDLYFGK